MISLLPKILRLLSAWRWPTESIVRDGERKTLVSKRQNAITVAKLGTLKKAHLSKTECEEFTGQRTIKEPHKICGG